MWIHKGVALIGGRRLFEETWYPNETFLKLTSNVIQYYRPSYQYSEFDFVFSE